MAMLASDMNCLAAVGVEDFFTLARPRSTDRERLRAGKLIVFLSGIAAALVALKLAHTQGSALALYYTITAIVAGGLAGLFLLAFLVPRASRAAAIAGIAANLIFTAYATLTLKGNTLNLGRYNFPWHDYMIGAIGHLILLAVGLTVTAFAPAQASDLTLWTWLRTRNNPRLEIAPQISSSRDTSTISSS
jgi:SSS family solute:Na+ symporter